MGRPFLCLFFSLSGIFFSAAQSAYQPAKFIYNSKEYFVYPVRSGNVSGIPPTGLVCPDGDYALFFDYEFRSKLLQSNLELKDTTKVSALFKLKNNLPHGNAVFLGYDFTSFYSSTISKVHTTQEEGNFENGLKEGEWIKKIVNSRWAKSHPNANKTTCNYHKGLLEGDWKEYDMYGNLQKTEKYRGDRLTDTVSFYSGEKLVLQYDVYDALFDTTKKPEDNFYDFILQKEERFQVLGAENIVKSFYKSWDENGKLVNFVKFRNGKNPFFDTLHIGPSEKLVVKKLAAPNEFSVKVISNYWNEAKTTEEFFRNKQLYFTSTVTFNKKTKHRDSVSCTYTDLRTGDAQTWNDLVWAKKFSQAAEVKLHIVPAIGYTWEEWNYLARKTHPFIRNYQKPVSIDTANKIVHVTDTFFYLPSGIQKIQQIDFKQQSSAKKKELRPAPFLDFDFLTVVKLLDFQNHFSENYPGITHATDPLILEPWKNLIRNFSGEETSALFVENDQPINRKIILTNQQKFSGSKKFDVQPVFTSKIYYTLMRFELKNGIREGTFEFLKKNKPSGIKNNFEETFLKKPKHKDSYIIAHFKNGKLNGNLREYRAEKKVFLEPGNFPENSIVENKVRTFVFADVNYQDGELHGSYKTGYINSSPNIITAFQNGKPDGSFEHYFENGKISIRCNFKNNGFDGLYNEFSNKGAKKVEAYFKDNRLQGEYTEFFENGATAIVLKAENNVVKTRTSFFENKNKKDELIFSQNSLAEFSEGFTGLPDFFDHIIKQTSTIYNRKKMLAKYAAYYEDGKTLCEGTISEGKPSGNWKFYNVAGNLVNEVRFKDTSILFLGDLYSKDFVGVLTGYFNNGKLRCTAFVSSWESGYDCTVHQDKTKFTTVIENAWSYDGKPIIKNGNGAGIIYDENGSRISLGQLVSYKPEGIWKFYDANQKINATGKFVKGEKDGLWYSGDLENMNFEDGACFNPDDKAAKQKIEYNKKVLRFRTEIYRNGVLLESENFETDLNKNRKREN